MGGIAAQGGAVEFDEGAGDLVTRLFQRVDAPREKGLAGAGRADQQHWRGGADHHPLDFLDQAVEGFIARRDAALEEVERIAAFALETLRQRVVARQVEIDQRIGAARVFGFLLVRQFFARLAQRRGLHQPRRYVARFDEQEPANLRDVSAGGDMYEVVLALGVERIVARPVVERGVDLLEIPRIAQLARHRAHLGAWRQLADVARYPLCQRGAATVVEQLQPVDVQVGLRTQTDGRPPAVETISALAHVELGAEKAEHHAGFGCHVFVQFNLATMLAI